MATEGNATFAQHISELRRRLMWSVLFLGVGAGIGYALHDWLLVVLQQPLHEKLYYTTPAGAFSFVIKVCTVFGFIVALPVMIYHGFAFFEPLVKAKTKRILLWYVFVSVVLALAGIAFAYFVSLPAALHFLVNFGGGNIEALITANEYFNFVLAYLAGFALLFQLPLILAFINRLTPLTPSKLMGGTRYVILGSFIVAAVITPTPDPLNQLLMAGPVILLYFASAAVIAFRNRVSREQEPEPSANVFVTPKPSPRTHKTPVPLPTPAKPRPSLPMTAPASHRRVNDIIVSGRNVTVSAYHQRPHIPQPSIQIQKNRPSPRLISDFIPASE